MRVVVGGTFDMLHAGHEALLNRAFSLAGRDGAVLIGLSSDEFVQRKAHPVRCYDIRKEELVSWIAKSGFETAYTIEALDDSFGPSLTADFDVLVVSYETANTGNLINEKRRAAGKAPVRLSLVQCVFADDGKAVSTTRIYRGEINQSGAVCGQKDESGENCRMQ